MEIRKHAVIIRMKYAPDYPQLEWRLNFFEKSVLPCFLNQTNQDFDLWVIVDESYRKRVNAMSPRIRTLVAEGTGKEMVEIPCGTLESFPYAYRIQTRHDCDDLVTDIYIEMIQQACEKWQEKQQIDDPLLISFQPLKYELNTWITYKMALQYADRGWCSMFASLYQPGEIKGYIYEACHRKELPAKYPHMVHFPEGQCYMVVHDNNVDNKIKAVDTIEGNFARQYRGLQLMGEEA